MKKITLLVLFVTFQIQSQKLNLTREVDLKIEFLEKLIEEAEKKRIDVLKEKTTIVTAKMFLKFAKWDENNIIINEKQFSNTHIYKKEALQFAKKLPRFERKEIVKILNKAISEITLLTEGKIKRQPSVSIDWSEVVLERDQITYRGRPVFLSDYIFKPKATELSNYYGNQDILSVSLTDVLSNEGLVDQRLMDELSEKKEIGLGFVYLNNSRYPKWSAKVYKKEGVANSNFFTPYDLDNPLTRKIEKMLLGEVVPYMAGRKFSALGYVVSNDLYSYDYKNSRKTSLSSSIISKYTLQKFRKWLSIRHKNITNLNKVWNTNFINFEEVTIQSPIDASLKGTPKWYDWTLFNMYKLTDWFTYLKYRIKKEDPEAKIHMQVNPNLWTSNKRNHGIDLEALTDISGIIGNKTEAEHIRIFGKPHFWESKYKFNWREMCMGFDFMKSVSPNKINYNSECHYLSTKGAKDLYLDPLYARASFWLAHMYGMTASHIWYWPRNEDGSLNLNKSGNEFAGTNNQQASVTNEVAMTMIDLNSNAEDIMSIQRQKKSIRIFYSKTSAINKTKHMDDVFELYESLNFEGTPIGFVTKGILDKQEYTNWDVILIRKTEFVTQLELDAVQSYLNKGGTVFIDDISFKKNEYGEPLNIALEAANGQLIKVSSLKDIKIKALALLKSKKRLSKLVVSEGHGERPKGCIWRVVKNKDGDYIVSIVNVGKEESKIKITINNSTMVNCEDVISGVEKAPFKVLKPYEVFFVKVSPLK